jgi:hypothetical protein
LDGIARAVLSETGPSVVSLNGVVASLAATEFVARATGLQPPWVDLTIEAIWVASR